MQPGQLKELAMDNDFHIPRVGAKVLDLCGGHGYRLWQFASIFKNSTLVLLDANPTNILHAMELFAQKTSYLHWNNQIEIKLCDARLGFGGIPYPDQTFDLITMLGHSDAGMDNETFELILTEAIRVIRHVDGIFVVDSPVGWRFMSVFKQLSHKWRIRIGTCRPPYFDPLVHFIFMFSKDEQENLPKLTTSL